MGKHADEPVQNAERNHSGKEVVVYKATGKDHQGKNATAAFFHVFIHGPDQQGEENNDFMKMVKKDIIGGKAGKGVQDSSPQVRGYRFLLSAQIDIPR